MRHLDYFQCSAVKVAMSVVSGDTLLYLEKEEKYVSLPWCLVPPAEPVQPSSRGFHLAFCVCSKGTWVRTEGIGREYSDPMIIPKVTLCLFCTFQGQAGSGKGSCSQWTSPLLPEAIRAKDLAFPHSLFPRKRDTSFWVPICLWCKVYALLK